MSICSTSFTYLCHCNAIITVQLQQFLCTHAHCEIGLHILNIYHNKLCYSVIPLLVDFEWHRGILHLYSYGYYEYQSIIITLLTGSIGLSLLQSYLLLQISLIVFQRKSCTVSRESKQLTVCYCSQQQWHNYRNFVLYYIVLYCN